MRTSYSFSFCLLPVTAALAIVLSNCAGNASSPGSVPGAPVVQSRVDAHATQKTSWINPALKSHRLLYVADLAVDAVLVYTYPELTYAGELTGFTSPLAGCTDGAGNIWIVSDHIGNNVEEFAHGGTSPLQTLNAYGVPNGCAINPKTGDLALSNGSTGAITIYHNATGNPIAMSDSAFVGTSFLGYDNEGNLFVDGSGNLAGAFHFAELPAGSSSFTDLTLNETPSQPGNVQWDGQYVDIGDLANTIYRTQGATVIDTVTLPTKCLFQFYILPSHKRIVAPDPCNTNADIYNYPAVGSPIRSVTGGLETPVGVVVSR